MNPVVFLPEPMAAAGPDLLRTKCTLLEPWAEETDPKRYQAEDYRVLLYEADAVIVRLFNISAQDIQLAKRLKVIGKHGVGVDNIDCLAATKAGVPVVYTPLANANAVAELAILTLAPAADNARWSQSTGMSAAHGNVGSSQGAPVGAETRIIDRAGGVGHAGI